MSRENQIVEERLRKIKELRDKKVNPYPAKFEKNNSIGECLNSKMGASVKTAGRIMSKRDLGKIAFGNLKDYSGEIQLAVQDKETPEKIMSFFQKYADIGDFVGVSGKIIKTKTGQHSILVKDLEILTKSILPLPEKRKGLQNDEEKFRKRYLDILMDDEVREIFVKKSKFWNSIRSFLLANGFLEVETPVL